MISSSIISFTDCVFFQKGKCDRENCLYRHMGNPNTNTNRFSSIPCEKWENDYSCKNLNCPHLHTLKNESIKICKFFQIGNCKNIKCRFLHKKSIEILNDASIPTTSNNNNNNNNSEDINTDNKEISSSLVKRKAIDVLSKYSTKAFLKKEIENK
jgi:hypothetical protein